MSEQNTLTAILKKAIKNYEQSITEVTTLYNSSLTLNKDLINKLKKSPEALIDLDLSIIEAILIESNTPDSEKESILSYLETTKSLLKLNSEKQTTFQISEEQTNYLTLFLEKVGILEKKHRIIKKNNNHNLDELNKICSKYKTLLSRLEDEKDNSYITNIDLLNHLFEECELDEITKRNIMLNLMRYNQNIYLNGNA